MSADLKLVNEEGKEATKEQYVVNYLKSMIAIEQAMEPYKEQKKELDVFKNDATLNGRQIVVDIYKWF